MKHLVFGLTDVEAIRQILNEAVKASPYTQKELAHQLSLRFPVDNWSERSLNYMLTESVDVPLSKANQLLNFLFPDEKFEFSADDLQDKIDEMYSRLSLLRADLSKALKDHMIDTNELNLLKAQVTITQTLFYKFLEHAGKTVNHKLN